MKQVKTFLWVFAMVLLVISPIWAEPNGGWEKVREMTTPPNCNIAGFINETTGMAVGYSGACQYTNDGGKTWSIGKNESLCRFGLEIIDAKTAYNSGNGGHVRVTGDGGRDWEVRANVDAYNPYFARYISFINPTTGWIASPKKLWVTSDGAKEWNEIDLPFEIQEIAAISLRTSTEGYLLDTSTPEARLFMTKDGGKTWTSREMGIKGGRLELEYETTPHSSMRFVSATNGIIVINRKDGLTRSLQTSDGGQSWSQETLSDASILGAVFLSQDGKYLTVSNKEKAKLILLRYH